MACFLNINDLIIMNKKLLGELQITKIPLAAIALVILLNLSDSCQIKRQASIT